jgi:hypothetical protein
VANRLVTCFHAGILLRLFDPKNGVILLGLFDPEDGSVLLGFFDPEVEGGMFLRNVGYLSTDYTVLYLRK